jgi:hypothetical protein
MMLSLMHHMMMVMVHGCDVWFDVGMDMAAPAAEVMQFGGSFQSGEDAV